MLLPLADCLECLQRFVRYPRFLRGVVSSSDHILVDTTNLHEVLRYLVVIELRTKNRILNVEGLKDILIDRMMKFMVDEHFPDNRESVIDEYREYIIASIFRHKRYSGIIGRKDLFDIIELFVKVIIHSESRSEMMDGVYSLADDIQPELYMSKSEFEYLRLEYSTRQIRLLILLIHQTLSSCNPLVHILDSTQTIRPGSKTRHIKVTNLIQVAIVELVEGRLSDNNVWILSLLR